MVVDKFYLVWGKIIESYLKIAKEFVVGALFIMEHLIVNAAARGNLKFIGE